MIVNAPPLSAGGPSRALVLKKWFKINIQVFGPETLFLGTSKAEAGQLDNGAGQQDGLEITATLTEAIGPLQIWWIGELWVSGSGDGATAIIVIPGLQPSLFEAGGGQCSDES